VFDLPPSLTRHFLDRSGRFDYRALLRTADQQLIGLASRMPAEDRAALYGRLRGLRLTFVERLMAHSAGLDIDRQRLRFLWILEEADAATRLDAGSLQPVPGGKPGLQPHYPSA
jgi:hypothetical protein